jgi:hypothetical protein
MATFMDHGSYSIRPRECPTIHTANATAQQPTYPAYAYWTANAVVDPATGLALEYNQLRLGPDSKLWIQGATNEMGRLAQGLDSSDLEGTNTIHFIKHTDLPTGRKATYLRVVANYKPTKKEPHRIRFTAGGDRIEYHGRVSTQTCELTTIKLLLNSTLSTPDAEFMTMDIKDFYLNTPMEHYEYMRIPLKTIPDEIIRQYKLLPLVHNGSILVEIRKGMYGLPQAGYLANVRLRKHLAKHGYRPTRHTPGLFTHDTRPITFALVVDDFGVKYVGREHAEHLLATLRLLYEATTDWTGRLYCGITLTWDYTTRTCDLSMPDYVRKALERFCHNQPLRPQHSPHAWLAPIYGSKIQQLTPHPDATEPLDRDGKTRIQEIIGVLLFYARAIDSTMLVALGTLASAQSQSTQATALAVTQLLNYCATHPDAVLRYSASDMHLHVHSDASYLSESKARSRAGGLFFLSDKPKSYAASLLPPTPDSIPPPLNGAIHIHCSIMDSVLSSATEAETGALFYNAKDAAPFRIALDEMGHPQTATPIQSDNKCAVGIVNDTVKQRRSKAMDMRFYWVKDRVSQGHYHVHWRKGADNLADYFTKHHSPSHHRLMRSRYLIDLHRQVSLQGCVDPQCGPPSGLPQGYVPQTDVSSHRPAEVASAA